MILTSARVGPLIVLLILLIVWHYAVQLSGVETYIFPSPQAVFTEMSHSFSQVAPHLIATLFTSVMGFLFANILALAVAILVSQSHLLRNSLLPILVGFQAIPIVAIAPFALIWFGSGFGGRIFLSLLICYFPAAVIVTSALFQQDRESSNFFDSIGATRWQKFVRLSIPSSVPAITASAQVTATLSVVGSVVAELSGSSNGAGYLILQASYQLHTAKLFAILILLSLLAFSFYAIVRWIGATLNTRFGVLELKD